MSLQPDDRRAARSRSKSPARRTARDRSTRRDEGPAILSPDFAPAQSQPSTSTPQYDLRQPGHSSYITPGQVLGGAANAHQNLRPNPPSRMDDYTMGAYADLPPHERPGYVSPSSAGAQQPALQYAQPSQWGYSPTPINSTQQPPQPVRNVSAGYQPGTYQYAQPDAIKYTTRPVTAQAQAQPPPPVYHKVTTAASPPSPMMTAMPQPHEFYPPPPSPGPPQSRKAEKYDPDLAYGVDNARVVEVKPGKKHGAPPSPGLRPHGLSVHGSRPELAPPSPGLTPRLDRLSVTGNRLHLDTNITSGYPSGAGGALPPASPLLEAYHGTYQSISPIPSPIMHPREDDIDNLPPLELRSSDERKVVIRKPERHRSSSNVSRGLGSLFAPKDKNRERSRSRHREEKREKKQHKPKRVKIYDAEEDASDILNALTARKEVETDVLIDVLPPLTHDQLLELRTEYKRICKIQGKGVNLAKHIKLKLPSGSYFSKICYVTALGRWESEAFWANYWYQGGNSKRELLIEALMGRSNFEIREIRSAFKDKRYADDLIRCMETELKKDKFRMAILTALEARRQEESDFWPPEYRDRDVEVLAKGVRARDGGETDILRIVTTRSDEHLRECLRLYERRYGGNFAREVLRKSGNLVGEICAHILNGVINRPARDAMLLRHALLDLIDTDPATAAPSNPHHHGSHHHSSNPSDKKDSHSGLLAKQQRQHRYELLISRLVRLHWDRRHLQRVKLEYVEKYGVLLEEDLEEATKGDFREFCLALCDVGVGERDR
ncbi:uncharacterized protein J3D65DRAFT_362515 [Phyllosticta citribraziliensis]|uniref:Annexin n=1 Tax=Phyllosticta citribraziliensis TaxID=989973 RepID=A0ABR1LTC7_9PEZI